MRLSRRAFAGLVAAALLSAACMSSPPPPETVIYLVRHAEKQTGDDPSLTVEGQARAEELAQTLQQAGITAGENVIIQARGSATGGGPWPACRTI